MVTDGRESGQSGQSGQSGGVAGLCFPEVAPLQLLGFDPERREPEMEYDAFGHTCVPVLELASSATQGSLWVTHPRVFALHSADDGDAHADDIDLEFWVDDDTAVLVSLALFLERRAPALLGGAQALVLALCNPYRARIPRPAGVAVPIFYAEGDVIAFMDVEEQDGDSDSDSDKNKNKNKNSKSDHAWSVDDVCLRLIADRWHQI